MKYEGQHELLFQCHIPRVSQWNLNGQELPTNAVTSPSGHTLTLTRITMNSLGTYICEGKDEDGEFVFGGGNLSADGNLHK